jgi:hypothetical protein
MVRRGVLRLKWKSHIAIAKAIADSMGFPKDLEREFSQGSIEPDKRPDKVVGVSGRGRVYVARAPHHRPSLSVVMKHIWNARRSYLNNDYLESVKSLGRALHYVQDSCLSKGFLGLSHGSREEDLLSQKVSVEFIEAGLKRAVCSPHYVKDTIRKVRPSADLREIMSQACLYSAAIAKAVLGEKKPPNKLVEDFQSAKEKYRERTIPVSISILLGAVLVSIAAFTLWHIESWQLALLLILSIFAGYLAQRLDLKYHYLKEEAKWFKTK